MYKAKLGAGRVSGVWEWGGGWVGGAGAGGAWTRAQGWAGNADDGSGPVAVLRRLSNTGEERAPVRDGRVGRR
jgi:hypothetical protein